MPHLSHGELGEGFALPPAPDSQPGPVKAWTEALHVPPYSQAIHLENEFLRLLLLPERGGRIQIGLDKITGYEFFPRQSGFAFPWTGDDASAAGFLLATSIEEHPDGSKTVWCSRYHPVSRIKEMHGLCLYPGRAYIEFKARLFNRTPFPQNFRGMAGVSEESSENFSCHYDPHQQAGFVRVIDNGLCRALSSPLPLASYETKAFSQFCYPIGKIGPIGSANIDAAVSWQTGAGEPAQVGVYVTRAFPKAIVTLEGNGNTLAQWTRDLLPAAPFVEPVALPTGAQLGELTLKVLTSAGRPLISYAPGETGKTRVPALSHAGPPPSPKRVETAEQLYLIGLQLLQEEERSVGQPEDYWLEALRRDGSDSRCNTALGLRRLPSGDFTAAEAHFRQAIATLTARTPNPDDRAPFYYLGLVLRYEERDDEAYDALEEASWSFPWRAPALHALAEIETKRGNYGVATKHLYEALRLNADNNYARNLAAMLFRRFGKNNEAEQLLRESLALDPLDVWACHLSGRPVPGDNGTRLDLAFDYARAGLYGAAIEVLTAADPLAEDGSLPAIHYALASFYTRTGDLPSAQREYLAASQSSPEGYVPRRLEELTILARAVALQPHDARAQYHLANLLYERGRHEEAMELWDSSTQIDLSFAAAWRNLGTGYYNLRNEIGKACEAFDKALAADPSNARILYERDQLWKRAGVPPAVRLKELEERLSLAESLDESAVELAELFNDVHQPVRALAQLSSRPIRSEDGVREKALEQHVRTHLKLGRQALKGGDPMRALNLFFAALQPPANLGEAQRWHPEIWFWLGEAYSAAQDRSSAGDYWRQAASVSPDFRGEMVFYSALALDRLGERFASRKLLRELWFQGRKLAREKPHREEGITVARPALHTLKDDPAKRHHVTGLFLQTQARLGLGQYKLARKLLDGVLALDPNHSRTLDLLAQFPQAS